MFNKQRFVKLLQAMQKTNTSCARTFARFAGFEDVSKIQHDLRNVPDEKKNDASYALQYDAEANVLRTVVSLVTDEAFFETMCKTHQITKENKKP